MDWLAFQVWGEQLAVSLHRVQEVSTLGWVTRVPGAPPAIRGVVNLRGSVIPVVDVAVRLGLPRTRLAGSTCLIHARAVVDGTPEIVGLSVDALVGILRFAAEDVVAPPAGLFARERDLLAGIGRIEGRLVPLLEIDVLADVSRLWAAVPGISTHEAAAPAAYADVIPDRLEAPLETAPAPCPSEAIPRGRSRSRPVRARAGARPPPGSTPTSIRCAAPAAAARDRASPAGARAIPARPAAPRGRSAWVIAVAALGVGLLLLLGLPRLEDRRGAAELRGDPRAPDAAAVAVAAILPTPEAVRAAPAAEKAIHEVRSGDTLWALSHRYYGSPSLWPKIFAANRGRIEDPDLISPGERLYVPSR